MKGRTIRDKEVLVRCGAPYCVLRDERGECTGEILAFEIKDDIVLIKYRKTDGQWEYVRGGCCTSNGDRRPADCMIPYKDFTGRIIREL